MGGLYPIDYDEVVSNVCAHLRQGAMKRQLELDHYEKESKQERNSCVNIKEKQCSYAFLIGKDERERVLKAKMMVIYLIDQL